MKRVVVIGGGAAGFFGAITCAEAAPGTEIVILEKGPDFLQKVRISGGGRCNVTHACFDPRELTRRYPRGERELIGPYHRFQAADTVRWFESRGVKLKIETDGRMFPITDKSQTVIDCLLNAARKCGIQLICNRAVTGISRTDSGFNLTTSTGDSIACDKLLLATGGCRTPALGALAVSLGHTLEPPVPSLFTFHINVPWVKNLAGVSIPEAEASVPGTALRERGPLLFTHWGLSGPVILRLSAWGARALEQLDYKFPLRINWLGQSEDKILATLETIAKANPAKFVSNTPLPFVPARLWTELVSLSNIRPETRWSSLQRAAQQSLLKILTATELPVSGKSLNKDEFVTCGGVRLTEVNFKTMESKLVPGLFFAGELLDIDGITGGFNFQAAWTTGWIAGHAIAESR
ncbi:MAG: NAD(P)/FAD-dependent oxidoreductase [Limisphaerales bacterium]